jgi:ABC-type siderophore export system fused ATPase/permease subunit
MKNTFFKVFRILIALVLIGKILNWFLVFNDEINQMLNIAMFSLIGLAYIVMGYAWDNKLLKIIVITCGVFLIAMNFFVKNVIIDIVGIACTLAPMLIARFYRNKKGEIKVAE